MDVDVPTPNVSTASATTVKLTLRRSDRRANATSRNKASMSPRGCARVFDSRRHRVVGTPFYLASRA